MLLRGSDQKPKIEDEHELHEQESEQHPGGKVTDDRSGEGLGTALRSLRMGGHRAGHSKEPKPPVSQQERFKQFIEGFRSTRNALEGRLLTATTGYTDIDALASIVKSPDYRLIPDFPVLNQIWQHWLNQAHVSLVGAKSVKKPEVPKHLTQQMKELERKDQQQSKRMEYFGKLANASNAITRSYYRSQYNKHGGREEFDHHIPEKMGEVERGIAQVYEGSAEHLIGPLRAIEARFRERSELECGRDLTSEIEAFAMVKGAITTWIKQG
jgi:hypothetical protein